MNICLLGTLAAYKNKLKMIEQIVILSLFSILTGMFSYFVHWAMGSPNGVNGGEGSNIHSGRIFSFLGVKILNKFEQYEVKSSTILLDSIKDELSKLESIKDEKINFFLSSTEVANPKICIEKTHNKYLIESTKLKAMAERKRRLNPYKSLGACLTCFCVWVSKLSFIIIYITHVPFCFYSILFFVPLSVITSKYLNKSLT